MPFFLVLLVLAAFPILAIVAVVMRARQMRALVELGRVTRGKVVARTQRGSPRGTKRVRRVQLMYERPDTGERRRWISVTTSEWNQLTEGAEVDLVYLPDKPGVFALKSLIDKAR